MQRKLAEKTKHYLDKDDVKAVMARRERSLITSRSWSLKKVRMRCSIDSTEDNGVNGRGRTLGVLD